MFVIIEKDDDGVIGGVFTADTFENALKCGVHLGKGVGADPEQVKKELIECNIYYNRRGWCVTILEPFSHEMFD